MYRKMALRIARLLFSNGTISSRLILSYASSSKNDGLGAQFQRILALNGLGVYWGLTTRHSPISQIATHPLDGFANDQEYLVFLNDLNSLIDADNSLNSIVLMKSLYFHDLRLRHVIRVFFIALLFKRASIVKVTHPYYFIDAQPSIYQCAPNFRIKQKLKTLVTEKKSQRISLHHRHGVGNMAIQPGQKNPREIAIKSYLHTLSMIVKKHPKFGISIFTDAPTDDFIFNPPEEQRVSWINLPAFDGESMKISGGSFRSLMDELPVDIEVIRGGNPLNSLANLASSSILVLSRSSFGYVAAILSENAEIFVPEDFWHPPLPGWQTYKINGHRG